MPENHLDWGLLRRAMRGEIGPWEVVRVLLRHVVEVCPRCQRQWSEQSGRSLSLGAELARLEYSAAFSGALELLPRRCVDLQRERREAPILVDELASLEEETEQIRLLEEESRFQTWGVCDLLISHSRRAAFEDPAMAQGLARLAIELVDHLDSWKYGASFLEDVRALGYAYLANGLRMASQLRQAQKATDRARRSLELGAGDPLVMAQVLSLEASLRRDQRRFDEAQRLLDEVILIYRETGEAHLEGRALVKKAYGLREACASQEAIPVLRRAVKLIDPQRDTRLLLCARHNLIYTLLDCGRSAEARKLLDLSRDDYAEYRDFWTQLRLRWVEGKLAAVEGRYAEAETFFLGVREGFLDNEVGYDAALVSLDLALLYLAHGRNIEVMQLARQMYPIFHAQDVHREAVAALVIFQKAALSQNLTSSTVEGIAAYLRRARHDPSFRYEEPS